MKQRSDALAPDVCEGLSIRDSLFEFLVQAIQECVKYEGKKKRRWDRAYGQQQALAYAIALIDNPYRVLTEPVVAAARLEVETRSAG